MLVLSYNELSWLMLISRTPWRGDEDLLKKMKTHGQVNYEGYVNVASELGLSGVRGKPRIIIFSRICACLIMSRI